MILTDGEILKQMKKGKIVIEPFNRKCLGSNSYDVHLSPHLAQYVKRYEGRGRQRRLVPLDVKRPSEIKEFDIPKKGIVLQPGEFYLGSTMEYTETHGYVPWFDGKSSIGRLGIFVHVTAGRGDAGFLNHWTLEIAVLMPIRVYAGMPIGQLTYMQTKGKFLETYDMKKSAKYNGRNPRPMASRMWKNFERQAA